MFRLLRSVWPVLALLLLGIGMRVFGAWATAHSASPDHSVATLMSRHIAEGTGCPVFYYGQPYMGSLEPIIGAAFCLPMGPSGVAVNLGTALCGVLLLFVIYAWGRSAAGPIAGMAALAYAAIGSPSYFQFMSWSYGGYAALVFLSAWMVWLAARIRHHTLDGIPVGLWAFALLGAVVGLGWWTSQLIAPAVAVAAVLLIPLLRRPHLIRRVAVSTVAFLLASGPFWVWNAMHDWATFRHFSAQQAAAGSYLDGVISVGAEMLFGLTGFGDVSSLFSPWARGLRFLIPVAVLLFLFLVARRLRGEDRERRTPYLVGTLLFLVALPLIAASSSRYSSQLANRYLLPAFPAIAVVIGTVTAWLVRRLRYGLGWLPLGALIVLHASSLPVYREWRTADEKVYEPIKSFGDYLDDTDLECVFLPYAAPGGANYSLNFLLDERCTFSVPGGERYSPYARRAELSEDIGVLNNHGDMIAFLETSGGRASYGGVSGFNVHYGFDYPSRSWSEVPPTNWGGAIDSEGRAVLRELADARLDTRWFEPGGENDERWVDVRFKEPVELCGVRMVSYHGREPDRWGVTAFTAAGGATQVVAEIRTTPWFWSGSRPYWRGEAHRVEAQFRRVVADGVRIHVVGDAAEISELQFFSPGPLYHSPWSARSIRSLMIANRWRTIYCSRWMANQIHRMGAGTTSLSLEPSVFGDTEHLLPKRMRLDPSTLFVVRNFDAPLCKRVLAEVGVVMFEHPLDSFVTFSFGDDTWKPEYASVDGLVWRGYACLLDSAEPREDERTPEIAVNASFENGVDLLGISVLPRDVPPGETVDVSLFWRCSGSADLEGLAVFAHFKSAGTMHFQGDHIFEPHVRPLSPGVEETVVETRRVQVPPDAPVGSHAVELGLYTQAAPHTRLRVRCATATDDRSVRIPDVLRVGGGCSDEKK